MEYNEQSLVEQLKTKRTQWSFVEKQQSVAEKRQRNWSGYFERQINFSVIHLTQVHNQYANQYKNYERHDFL